jgi:hypothetical protein
MIIKATFHASLFHRLRAPLPPGACTWGRPARPAPHPLESASLGCAGRALGSPRYREPPSVSPALGSAGMPGAG